MQVHSFTADSAADAVAQIRAELGPDAVVLNVRQLPVEGLSRLWQKPRIEVMAYVPEKVEPAPAVDSLADLRQELAAIKQQMERREVEPGLVRKAPPIDRTQAPVTPPPAPIVPSTFSAPKPPVTPAKIAGQGMDGAVPPIFPAETASRVDYGQWRVGKFLETSGLLPLHTQRIVDDLIARHGVKPPESIAQELQFARQVLTDSWPNRPLNSNSATHILIGAAGVGKTTCICKWLAQSVLVEGRSAHVWRLDGKTANTAESLSVYCDILGVTLERFVPPTGVPLGAESLFIDLPGVPWHEPQAAADLGKMIGDLPPAQVHLVLNAAYEMPLLMAQARAFSALPVTDVIFTHLDEETRWGKLWNFVFGTNFSPGFLSAGQNIPGDYYPASAEKILSRQFPSK